MAITSPTGKMTEDTIESVVQNHDLGIRLLLDKGHRERPEVLGNLRERETAVVQHVRTFLQLREITRREEGSDPLRLIKRLAHFTPATDLMKPAL